MNINRDYLIINDVKKSSITLNNGNMFFYITDKNTQNIFVNLVINISNNDLIQKYANIENAEDYTLTMNIVKPDNTYKVVEGKLHDKEKAIFEFNLNEDCCDEIGTYRCELLTKCNINGHEEITTSNKLTYKVKSSVLNDLDDIVEAPEYPLVIQLFDKLSDIEQYEEDRRANELARQLAEQQRQTRFNTLDNDMVNSIEAIDNKVVDVENRVSAKEQAVDTLIVDTKADIDEYKVAKDAEIDEYKATKDTEINNAITAQDNKINEFINERNDRLNAIEAKNTEQDNRLDVAENRLNNIGEDIQNTIQPTIDAQNSRLDSIEAVNVSQDNRLDAIEIKNQQQDDRLLDIEKVNSRQDIDIKCLYGASQTIDVTKEGNSIYLQNSNNGFAVIDGIKGNTLVNCNKEPDKELILNGNINTQGYSNVTLTEGVDGGKVDVALEGNTMVNVCDQKDPVAITKSYTVETGNHVALQGEYDGKCRPVVTGNTLVNLCTDNFSNVSGTYKRQLAYPVTGTITIICYNLGNYKIAYSKQNGDDWVGNSIISDYKTVVNLEDGISVKELAAGNTEDYGNISYEEFQNLDIVILEGDYTNKPIPEYFEGLQSSFEDKVVTQEMVDNGEESAENLGKYKVNYVVTGKNKLNMNDVSSTNGYTFENGILTTSNHGTWGGDVPYIKVYLKANATYKFSANNLKGNYVNSIWKDNKKIIDRFGMPGQTANLKEDGYYLLAIGSTINGTQVKLTNIQLEEGTEETPYEPYKEYTKTFYLNSPLLEGDTIEQQGDNVVHVHRSEELEDKTIIDITTRNNINAINGKLYKISYGIPYSTMYSDKLQFVGENSSRVNNINQFYGVGGSTGDLWVCLSNTLTTEQAQEFINSCKIIVPLKTPQYEVISQNDTILCDSYVNGHLDVDSVVPIKKVDFLPFTDELTYLYANTLYAVQFVSDAVSKVNITLGGAELLNQDVALGINKYTITTPSELIDNNLILNGEGFNASNIVVTEATDKDFGYFEGMKSVGECEDLEVVSGNSDSTLSNTQTLTHEPLRAVGDIKDKYVLIDGKWYIERNCGEVVLDGNISVCIIYNHTVNTDCYYIEIIDYDDIIMTNAEQCISEKFAYNGSFSSSVYVPPYSICTTYSTQKLRFLIPKSQISTTDIVGVNNYFANNPTKVIVKLASPTYEPIDYNPFEVYSDITHISNNSTIPCNMTIKNTGYNCLLKPSTTYTISSNLGLNTVTTPSTLTEDCLRFMDTDTSDVTTMRDVMVLEGDYTTGKPLPSHFSGIESAFEQEYDETVSKYKVKIRVQNEDASKENYIEFYINEPLRGIGDVKDKVYIKNDKVVVERNCGQREYQDGDFGTYPTDKVNTVCPLAEPTYEEVEYNDVKLFIESFKNSTLFYNSNVPVTSKLHYSYSVPIVDTVAQTADISNQQDSMIIDLATQVAVMEMMLM